MVELISRVHVSSAEHPRSHHDTGRGGGAGHGPVKAKRPTPRDFHHPRVTAEQIVTAATTTTYDHSRLHPLIRERSSTLSHYGQVFGSVCAFKVGSNLTFSASPDSRQAPDGFGISASVSP